MTYELRLALCHAVLRVQSCANVIKVDGFDSERSRCAVRHSKGQKYIAGLTEILNISGRF